MTRITYGMTNNHIQTGLSKNYGKLDQIMNQVSTQKRIQAARRLAMRVWMTGLRRGLMRRS